jgi:hypothetical protein
MKKVKLFWIIPVLLFLTGFQLQAKVGPKAFHFDYTDLAVGFTEQNPTSATNLNLLTDNDEYTVYTVEGVNSTQITVELEYPILLTVYGLASAPGSTVDVVDWTVESSLDGNTWKTIIPATQTSETPVKRPVYEYGGFKTYTTDLNGYEGQFKEDQRAKFFRLTATGNGKVEIGEWQLHGVPCIIDDDWGWPSRHFPKDLMGFDGTTEAPGAAGSISSNSSLGGNPYSAINGLEYWGGYIANIPNEGYPNPAPWLIFEFNEPKTARTYSISNSWTDSWAKLTAWKLWGSNSTGDAGWTLLDEQYGVVFPGEGNTATTLFYPIASPAEYKKYKLELSDNHDRLYIVSILEWQLFAEEGLVSAPQKTFAFPADYTDNALEITEADITGADNLKRLTDNDEQTIYRVEGVSSTQITVKTEYPILLSAYGLASSKENPVDVATWTVESSTDGLTWQTVTLSTASKKPVFDYGLFKTFQTPLGQYDSDKGAQYFRLTATGNGIVEIGEWQLYGLPVAIAGGWPPKLFPEDLTGFPDWQATTTDKGTITADQGSVWAIIGKQYGYGDFTGQRPNDASPICWFTFTFNVPTTVGHYTLSNSWGDQNAVSNLSQNPRTWNLWGKNSGGNWTLLDKQNTVNFPTEGFAASTLGFEIANPGEYTDYKMEILDNYLSSNGYWNNVIRFQQWQLFAPPTTPKPTYTITVTEGTANVSTAAKNDVIVITANVAPQGKRFLKWESEDVVFAHANNITTSFVMPDNDVSVTAIYEDLPKYTIDVVSGTADFNEAIAGEQITITANTAPQGKEFYQWESEDITVADAGNAVTTFIMPDKNVTVTATYDFIYYTITVVNGYANYDIAAEGDQIEVTADAAPSGKVFYEWESTDVTFTNGSNVRTTFTMPGKNVTATATYEDLNAINQVESGRILIHSEKGKMILNSDAQSVAYTVYNVTGQAIVTGLTSGRIQEIPLVEGIYLVKVNNKSIKVVIR